MRPAYTFIACALMLIVILNAKAAEVYLADGSTLPTSNQAIPNPLPVLFVHGHNTASDSDTDYNYRKNWQDPLSDLQGTFPSFQEALNLPINRDTLGIEPYYIRFQDQNRSIARDAVEIGETIGLILNRHDPNYDPNDLNDRSHVQIVVIAYSKGTISTRLYLKSLQETLPDALNPHIDPMDPTSPRILGPPRPDFRPVSEFIAISPPNHGLQPLLSSSGRPEAMSLRQLHNGYDRDCVVYDTPAEVGVTDFISNLNGQENAPGSRPNGAPPHEGTLYVTLFPSDNRDIVGGDGASNDCGERKRAVNGGTHAIDIPVSEVIGALPSYLPPTTQELIQLAIHQRAVHTPAVMCWALYIATHHRVPSLTQGVPCSVTDNAPPEIPPPPRAAVALALDFSGSMNAPACPGDPSCGTRRQVLQEAVEMFVTIWSALGGPGDSLGVSYFRTDVTPFTLGASPLITLHEDTNGDGIANWQDIIGNVNSQTASNLTAMGGGLQTAIGMLTGAGNNRRVVLFTDGLQNVNPMVMDHNSHQVINDEPGRIHSNVNPTPSLTPLNTIGMKVDVIGIGEGAVMVARLDKIVQDTGGSLKITVDPEQNLRQFFIEELVSSLRGFSPQLLAYRHGSAGNNGARETFSVTNSARRLVLKLSWRRGQKLGLRVEKDGVNVTSLGQVIDGPFYRLFVMDFPANVSGQQINPGGRWHMQITGSAGVSYQAAAIVDEALLDYDFSLGARAYRAGDNLDLALRLFAGEKPLTEGIQVSAAVSAPRQSVGTLLSQIPIPIKSESKIEPESNTTPTQRNLALLLQNKRHWQSLRPAKHEITLEEDGKGTYRASFGPVTVPGVYTVAFQIQGESPDLGYIQRTESASTLVMFGKAKFETSELRKSQLTKSSRGVELAFHVRPRDEFGNYLGPGFEKHIQLTMSTGNVADKVSDVGNGTYVISAFVPPNLDPELSLSVLGQELFKGRLSEVDPSDVYAELKYLWALIALVGLAAICLLFWILRRRWT